MEHEFRDFLTCGILAHGFARLRCTECALEGLVPFSCKARGFCPCCGGRRMTECARPVGRRGAAAGARAPVGAKPSVLDGVFFEDQEGALEFRPLPPPTDDEVSGVLARVAARVQRLLRRPGLDPWEADGVQADLLVDESPALAGISSASVQGRIALGPRAGAGPLSVLPSCFNVSMVAPAPPGSSSAWARARQPPLMSSPARN